jgi:hypothetical protein
MKRLALWVLAAILLSGCGPKLIPNLQIELADTPDHRALLKVMDSWRAAFQNKDTNALTALASPRFFESSGSTGTKDDFAYQGIKTHFEEHFKNVKQCVMDYDIKGVTVDKDTAEIDYHYISRYLMVLPSGERWQLTDDLARMKLVRENGEWKILSGM